MLNLEELVEKANAMRQCMTFSEQRAHDVLSGSYEFEQQVVFGFFILDFVIPSKMLVVEIDGESHLQQREYDRRRDAFCESLGLRVLRITNNLANTTAERVELFYDVPDYKIKWDKAKRKAHHQYQHIEDKKNLTSPERKIVREQKQAEREQRRREGILAVQALAPGASYEEVKQATRHLKLDNCPKKKRTPENRQARIEAGIAKMLDKKKRRPDKKLATVG